MCLSWDSGSAIWPELHFLPSSLPNPHAAQLHTALTHALQALRQPSYVSWPRSFLAHNPPLCAADGQAPFVIPDLASPPAFAKAEYRCRVRFPWPPTTLTIRKIELGGADVDTTTPVPKTLAQNPYITIHVSHPLHPLFTIVMARQGAIKAQATPW